MKIDTNNAPDIIYLELKSKHFSNSAYELPLFDPIVKAIKEYFISNGYDIRNVRINEFVFEVVIDKVIRGEVVMEIVYHHAPYLRRHYIRDKNESLDYMLKNKVINDIILTKQLKPQTT